MEFTDLGWDGELYSCDSGQGKVVDTCEYGTELSSSTKHSEFLDYMSNY
jgi:hypothetical protein